MQQVRCVAGMMCSREQGCAETVRLTLLVQDLLLYSSHAPFLSRFGSNQSANQSAKSMTHKRPAAGDHMSTPGLINISILTYLSGAEGTGRS